MEVLRLRCAAFDKLLSRRGGLDNELVYTGRNVLSSAAAACN